MDLFDKLMWLKSGASNDTHDHVLFLPLLLLVGGTEKDCMHHNVGKTRGIITLYRHQRAAFAITSKRGPAPKISKTSVDFSPGGAIGTDNDEVGTRA